MGAIFSTTCTPYENFPLKETLVPTQNFELAYSRVGYGVNMYDLQPVFSIKAGAYLFTYEEAWLFDGKRIPYADTISSGPFLRCSIDSILNILSGLQKKKIEVSNYHYTDGDSEFLTILANKEKYSFVMNNAVDSSFNKIMSIIKGYMRNVPLDIN